MTGICYDVEVGAISNIDRGPRHGNLNRLATGDARGEQDKDRPAKGGSYAAISDP
jgi:hypothetical protein